MNNTDFGCVIMDIMKRHFEENTYMSKEEFYIYTGIETRLEKLNPVTESDVEPEKTDD